MIPLLIIAIALAGLGADTPSGRDFVSVANTPKATVTAGKPARVDLKFRVNEGFHINSNLPRSKYLIPTKIKLDGADGIQVGKITYPSGQDMVFPFAPDEKLNVYNGEFTVTAALNAPPTAASGQHKLSGELTYQACNDRACYPPKKLPISIEVTVVKTKM